MRGHGGAFAGRATRGLQHKLRLIPSEPQHYERLGAPEGMLERQSLVRVFFQGHAARGETPE